MNEDRVLSRRIAKLATIQGTIKVLRKQMNKYKTSIISSMERRNLTRLNDKSYTVSFIRGYKKLAFSSRKVRDVEPELYKKLHNDKRFQVMRKRRPSIRVKRNLLN